MVPRHSMVEWVEEDVGEAEDKRLRRKTGDTMFPPVEVIPPNKEQGRVAPLCP